LRLGQCRERESKWGTSAVLVGAALGVGLVGPIVKSAAAGREQASNDPATPQGEVHCPPDCRPGCGSPGGDQNLLVGASTMPFRPLQQTLAATLCEVLPCAWRSLALALAPILGSAVGQAQVAPTATATGAAIHPAPDAATMQRWLARVPQTRAFPPDFEETLRGQGSLYIIEMTTAPGCVPCGDLWAQLRRLGGRYGWQVRTIPSEQAMIRAGRLGLPWVGHPVAWVRPVTDSNRTIPIAVGTDHATNLARNLYLAAKMLTGVRPAVAVRAMSKFTGIIGAFQPQRSGH